MNKISTTATMGGPR